MKIYEAFNWIKDADYTPHGFLIFNENTPEGQLKGEALKTIFEAAKNGELVTLEMFEAVKKERNEAVKRLREIETCKSDSVTVDREKLIIWARQKICDDFCQYTNAKKHGKFTQETLDEICENDCPLSKI